MNGGPPDERVKKSVTADTQNNLPVKCLFLLRTAKTAAEADTAFGLEADANHGGTSLSFDQLLLPSTQWSLYTTDHILVLSFMKRVKL